MTGQGECPIPRFAKIDDILWRGARPDFKGVEWLAQAGVKTIINLEWEETDEVPATAPIVNVQLMDWEPWPALAPRIEDEHIRKFLAVVSSDPTPIFVHCHSGQNRTGIAVAAYRAIVLGQEIESVVTDMKSFGGAWADSDINYVRSLAARRGQFQ